MKGRFRKGKKAARKFDGFEWQPGTSSKQRTLAAKYSVWTTDEYWSKVIEDEANHWACTCGNYIEDGLHCTVCGAEPPWGCDCSTCHDRARERHVDEDGYDPDFDPIYDAIYPPNGPDF